MASILKTATGYRAQLYVKGKREERSFTTKRDAQFWADKRGTELRMEVDGRAGDRKTLRDAMRRYVVEVAPTHKGERWERIRLGAMEDDPNLPVTLPLNKLTAAHLTHWKTERLRQVGDASVIREMGLLSSVLSHARRDWAWMTHSPLSDVRRPSQPRHRERLITWRETRLMLRELGWKKGRLTSMKQIVGAAFLMALRTGMRCSEIVGLEWARVHPSWMTLETTKNGAGRAVPMPPKVRRLLERMRGLDAQLVFPIGAASVDAMFRRARVAAGLDGFTFHDSRHCAATRIGRTVGQPGRLSFPEFVRVFGWRDPKNAMIYVNPSAASLADKMA